MTSPAVTCLVTIPHKVIMSHKRKEFFKVLTALIGYSEIFLTFILTPFIISLLHFQELNNLSILLHHNLKNIHLYICFCESNPYATDDSNN